MPGPTELETDRLVLKPTTVEHAAALYHLTDLSRAELMPWMVWPKEATLETTRSFAAACEEGWANGTAWNFTITCAGEVIGSCGLDRYLEVWESADLGYWIGTSHAGQGFITEAARAVVEFGFEDVGLHRISLHAAPDNPASCRVASKLGFTQEGLLRDGSKGAFGFHDCFVFGLLADDPRP